MNRDSAKPVPFLGHSLAIEEYDDDLVASAYIWRHYRHLMTPLERRRGEYAVPIVSNSESEKARNIHAYLEERDGQVPDRETLAAFQIPSGLFRAAGASRVRTECLGDIDWNRCAECGRIPRSPQARQCPWCGNDWH